MKLPYAFLFSLGFGIVSANPLVIKRASTGDQATVGFATLSGGTTGGGTATPVTVTTLSALKSALATTSAKVVIVSGTITGNEVVKVGSNTSVIGKSGAMNVALTGVGLRVLDASNIIIRNLKISKVLADAGDHISVQASNRIWIDSVELWADQDHDKDYYDGLLDITHGTYATSVTNSYLHDHWKGSLVGHSDSNESEDLAIQVTYAYNKWYNLSSRTPYVRFGRVHIFNNYFVSIGDAISGVGGARLLVQGNVFEMVDVPLYTDSDSCADVSGNDFGGASVTYTPCNSSAIGYSYTLAASSTVKASVNSKAGAKLSF
ncbi:unnamed protein product [Rhizoctonia solani]|uniref:Pectate lyase domain-containing protein n=1 Tax=Rhizoctonia solani TaxID=456999 RepID=A0A8H3C748_9AGAM|nr:unnamed protein product [Rhizoctonia solani]